MIRLLELATWMLLVAAIYFELEAALVADWRGMLAWAVAAAATAIAIGVYRAWR